MYYTTITTTVTTEYYVKLWYDNKQHRHADICYQIIYNPSSLAQSFNTRIDPLETFPVS